MYEDKRTIEDELFEGALIKKVAYKGTSDDPINRWLDRHTAMWGPAPTMQERETQEKEEFNEKLSRVFRTKRFTYQLWHYQEDPNGSGWFKIGQHDVDNKDDLNDLIERMTKKYNSEIKSELVKRNW